MATIVAVRSGNWSDTSHVTGPWPGGSTPTTKPGVDDTVQSDEYVITIDEDVTVALIESTSSGYFRLTDAPELPARRTVTAHVLNSGTANGALKISNPVGLVDITGSQTGGAVEYAYAIANNNGTIGDITGSQTGGAGENAYAINNNGTMGNVTGNITAGAGANAYGIYNDGTIGNVTGDITGGANAYGIYDGGTMGNVTGNITAGAGANAYGIYDGGTMGSIDGSLICGPSGLFPIYGPFKLVANSSNSIVVRTPDGDPWALSNDYPAEADVKSGVEYNRGTMTGELAAGGSIGPVSIVIGGGGIRIS